VITHVVFADGAELLCESHIHGRGDELAIGGIEFVVQDARVSWLESSPQSPAGIDTTDAFAVQFLTLVE
jgi:hypothetical protein